MRQNDRKPLEQFTACICNKCGENYEADREHICKKKNSYQRAENHFCGFIDKFIEDMRAMYNPELLKGE